MTETIEPTGPLATALQQRRAKMEARQAKQGVRATRHRTAGPQQPQHTRRQTKKADVPTPGNSIATGIKTVAGFAAPRYPLHSSIVVRQADSLGPIIDRLAAEDERVRAFIEKVGGLFGKGGAWGELAGWAFATGGALAVASGVENPILSLISANLVQESATDAAVRIAQAEALSAGQVDEGGMPYVDPARVQFIVDALLAPKPKPEPETDEQA